MKELSEEQINHFINEGYVKVDHAFPTEVADECRRILWEETKCNPNDPATWTKPVIRIPELAHEPFRQAANTEILHRAFDQLAGKDNWSPRITLGSFPIRFPGNEPAGDTGWHVDASFPGDEPNNYLQWKINVRSKGRALLMLFLFSDVAEPDAPTVIRTRSHIDVARILAPYGEEGLSFMALAERLTTLPSANTALATGEAGTVYLCHPFLVHAAQDHRGRSPKFMAQPSLPAKKAFVLGRKSEPYSPVEAAIVQALDG